MTATINTVSFPGYYENLSKIASFFRVAAEEAGFDGKTIYRVECAVDEACTNIIEHAYGGEGVGEIECSYLIDEKGLTITIKDFGQPFDPKKVKEPDPAAPLNERTASGLGIFFIKKFMDEVKFQSKTENGNILTLVKYL